MEASEMAEYAHRLIARNPSLGERITKSQSDSALQVVKELRECLPVSDVVADEEVKLGSLIAKAIDCSLRSVLLENGWRCVGSGCIVNSSFASSEEKKDLYAFHVVSRLLDLIFHSLYSHKEVFLRELVRPLFTCYHIHAHVR